MGSCRLSLPFSLLKSISKQVLDNSNLSRGLRVFILDCGIEVFGLGSRILRPGSSFQTMPEKSGKERRSLCLPIPKLSISSSYFQFLKCCIYHVLTLSQAVFVFLDEASEGMLLLYLLELVETAYLKVYGNYPEELFHVKKFSCSKDFRRSMVEVLQIYVCIMRK